jgi:hypothetical protein
MEINGCNIGNWLLWKVNGCHRKALGYKSLWLQLKVNGSYVEAVVAMKSYWVLKKYMVAIENQ